MGYLKQHGRVYTYDESKEVQHIYKRESVKQFQRIYDKFNILKTEKSELYWGDEVEYQIVHFDDEKEEVKLQPNTDYIFEEVEKNNSAFESLSVEEQKKQENDYFTTVVEYGAFMVETIPIGPYCMSCSVSKVKHNLIRRRELLSTICSQNGDSPMWISSHPMMGLENTFIPNSIMQVQEDDDEQTRQLKQEINSNHYGQSQGFQDQLITNHSRFRYLTMNVRLRRGDNPQIVMKVFQDINTEQKELIVDHFGYGMGNGCIQQTFSTLNIDNCRHVYDQLNILSPIMMAFTASTPFLSGKVLDTDCRWFIIA